MGDFINDFDSLDEAIEANESKLSERYESVKGVYDDYEEYLENEISNTWAHIYDAELREEVWKQA